MECTVIPAAVVGLWFVCSLPAVQAPDGQAGCLPPNLNAFSKITPGIDRSPRQLICKKRGGTCSPHHAFHPCIRESTVTRAMGSQECFFPLLSVSWNISWCFSAMQLGDL
jgi:hypothetical protein